MKDALTIEPTDFRQESAPAKRSVGQAMRRGALCRCPSCGEGKIYGRYLKVRPACEVCGQRLDIHRADDAPPYVVITIVGHIVIMGIMAMEEWMPSFPIWGYAVLWLPLTVIMSLALLPGVKGALIGMQWALRMHGFGDADAKSQQITPQKGVAS